jgi:biopolymer transport protein TolR
VPKVLPPQANGSSRSGRGRRVTSSLAEINVVPLVDVMLVLLIIFMVTAPMIQRGVDVTLPVARRTAQINGERLFITIPLTFRQNRQVYLNDERVRIDILKERIRQKLETQNEKQVYLRGDAGVEYQELMDVFDRLKDAGIEQVGLVARLPGEK